MYIYLYIHICIHIYIYIYIYTYICMYWNPFDRISVSGLCVWHGSFTHHDMKHSFVQHELVNVREVSADYLPILSCR